MAHSVGSVQAGGQRKAGAVGPDGPAELVWFDGLSADIDQTHRKLMTTGRPSVAQALPLARAPGCTSPRRQAAAVLVDTGI